MARSLGAPRFDDAVDWGILWFLTKPIFYLLDFFYQHVGNFGVAILMLTVVIRLITFPLANRGFEMGVKMKKIQPELKELQAKHKDDPGGAAEGDDGPLRAGEGQSDHRLPAGAVPDPGVLFADQTLHRHHRDVPRAVFRLDP